ncbi:K(+)-transporting ATPase subunit C [Saccharopolyspora sp. K220]|uniref:K(+)-transporting ATPase subunit C n=1 Tax=Saccharopolyspora soli TaxID=2926618 RepID=UPI001F567C98|nr:K(+)-transporting ATPase subunit C [Saccharopolyspora soli]MCI2418418.1 K(+)-transporting ATPase subunit C [Saccharopolyspora soli]
MRRQLLPALFMVLVFTVLTGGVYPLVVTGIAQLFFPDGANGSVVERDGRAVGSKLIGQPFTQPQYFHPRHSDAGDGYDATASSGSNLGPTNGELLYGAPDDPATADDESYEGIQQRVAAYRAENRLAPNTPVPVDAVTGSGSGLDPHISVANARLQAPRVAQARGLALDQVQRLVDEHTDGRDLGFLGEPAVHVLNLNLALDALPR